MKKTYEITHELLATKRLFKSDCKESLLSAGLYCGDKMLGYAISEKLVGKYAIVHFLRSVVTHIGINEALIQGYAAHLASHQIVYMNFESDLNYDAIRHFKTSWRPIKYLKRYNVRYTQT